MDTATSHNANVRVSPIQFSAGKWEYFKLWIVNLVLSIITLGIYSAWAKVRNTQYMYGHTQVDGHRLNYLATPMQILKGRLIALVLFVAYVVAIQMSQLAAIGLGLVVWLVSPYLMVQGLRFALRHTAYRNVRFGFTGTVGKAYVTFLLLPLLGSITFGLALPWVLYRMNRFIYDNIRFGNRQFEAELSVPAFYKASVLAFIVFAVPTAVIVSMILPGFDQYAPVEESVAVMIAFSPLVIYGSMFVAYCIFHVMIRNHILNMLESHELVEFRSNLQIGRYIWVALSNIFIVAFTLGLGYPIAEVRLKKLQAEATTVLLYSEIDNLVASSDELDSAFGEELSGFFDTDLSLT